MDDNKAELTALTEVLQIISAVRSNHAVIQELVFIVKEKDLDFVKMSTGRATI